MKFHRFNPYTDDYIRHRTEKQLAETARRKKYGFPANYQPMDNPIVKLKVQRKRNVSMRAKRLKVTLATVSLCLAWLLMHPQPAAACHMFSRWYYPYPQHCGGSYAGHQRRIHVHSMHSNPPVHVAVRRVNDVGVEFPLPDMNGTWQTALGTKPELELWEEMQRKKALMLIKGEVR